MVKRLWCEICKCFQFFHFSSGLGEGWYCDVCRSRNRSNKYRRLIIATILLVSHFLAFLAGIYGGTMQASRWGGVVSWEEWLKPLPANHPVRLGEVPNVE